MICTDCREGTHGQCQPGCTCQNKQHGPILTSQQRTDPAAYGTTDVPRVCPTCPIGQQNATDGNGEA